MSDIIMCCGHKAIGNEWEQDYYWKTHDGAIALGNLCSKCVPIYRAIKADNINIKEAREILKNDPGVTLQDICASLEGAKRYTERIGDIDWDIVEIPPSKKRKK